jgi:hypothetical protein
MISIFLVVRIENFKVADGSNWSMEKAVAKRMGRPTGRSNSILIPGFNPKEIKAEISIAGPPFTPGGEATHILTLSYLPPARIFVPKCSGEFALLFCGRSTININESDRIVFEKKFKGYILTIS